MKEDYDYYLNGIKQQRIALRHVPEEYKTQELCEIAVIYNNPYAFEFVPEELKTPEFCKLVISKHGRALEHVSTELMSFEMCDIAVLNNPSALQFVPEKFKTLLSIKYSSNE